MRDQPEGSAPALARWRRLLPAPDPPRELVPRQDRGQAFEMLRCFLFCVLARDRLTTACLKTTVGDGDFADAGSNVVPALR